MRQTHDCVLVIDYTPEGDLAFGTTFYEFYADPAIPAVRHQFDTLKEMRQFIVDAYEWTYYKQKQRRATCETIYNRHITIVYDRHFHHAKKKIK